MAALYLKLSIEILQPSLYVIFVLLGLTAIEMKLPGDLGTKVPTYKC